MIFSLSLLALVGCEGTVSTLLYGDRFDRDNDGHEDWEDCAPDNPNVWGDEDGDGHYSDQCEYAVFKCKFMSGEECYGDCDDNEPLVYTGFNNGMGEVADVQFCEGSSPPSTWGEPPSWSHDGLDNDCDGVSDIADFDLDTVVDGDDCQPCNIDISPLEEEHRDADDALDPDTPTEAGSFAYNAVDEDCSADNPSELDDDCPIGAPKYRDDDCCALNVGDTIDFDCDDDPALAAGGGDCDERAPLINSLVAEQCDSTDWNCSDDPLDGFDVVGEEFYLDVDASAPEGGNGSAAAPFNTLDDAMRQLGDCAYAARRYEVVVRIASGTYRAGASADLSDSSVESVTFRGEGSVTIEPGDTTALEFILGETTNLAFSGLVFQGSGIAVSVEGGTVSATDVQFYGLDTALLLDSVFSLTVDGIVVNDATSSAIVLGPSNFAVEQIEILNSDFSRNDGTSGGSLLASVGSLGSLEITNSTFTDGYVSSGQGGAVAVTGLSVSTVTVSGGSFTNNTAGVGGALSLPTPVGSAVISGTVWEGNAAVTGAGGAIYAAEVESLSLISLSMEDNTAAKQGGAVAALGGTSLSVTSSSFSDNGSGTAGGAIAAEKLDSLTVTGGSFLRNTVTSGSGGALMADTVGQVNLGGSLTFSDNRVTSGHGGAVLAQGVDDLDVSACTFSGNSTGTGYGGAVHVSSSTKATFDTVTFSNNEADDYGGALYANILATLALDTTTWTSNSLSSTNQNTKGGAIYVQDIDTQFSITGPTTFSSHSVNSYGGTIYGLRISSLDATPNSPDLLSISNSSASYGGCIYLDNALGGTLDRLDASDCTADVNGGAVRLLDSDLTVSDSKFEDNSSGSGGGAIATHGGTVTVANAWFSNNEGTAVRADETTFTLYYSMFSENGDPTENDASSPADLNVEDCAQVEIRSNTFYNAQSDSHGSSMYFSDSIIKNFSFNVMADDPQSGYSIVYDGVGYYRQVCNLYFGGNNCDTTEDVNNCGNGGLEDSDYVVDDDDVDFPDGLFASTSTLELRADYIDTYCPTECSGCNRWGAEAPGSWPLDSFP